MTAPVPSSRQLLASLGSQICPACGSGKRVRQTLCYPCFRAISPGTKRHLYLPLGSGYEEAVFVAFRELGVTEPTWPLCGPSGSPIRAPLAHEPHTAPPAPTPVDAPVPAAAAHAATEPARSPDVAKKPPASKSSAPPVSPAKAPAPPAPTAKVEPASIERVPTRPVRRGLWFDIRNNPALWEQRQRVGWTGLMETYAWPHLETGDLLVLRFPNSPRGTGNTARWADTASRSEEMSQIVDVVAAAAEDGIDVALYIRRPNFADLLDQQEAEDRLGAAVAPLAEGWFGGVTRIIDGAIEEGVTLDIACPWGAKVLGLFSSMGGRVVVEPAWAPAPPEAKTGWGWEWPCLVTDEYYQRMKREEFKGWRPWTHNVPEIMRVQPGLASGVSSAKVRSALTSFVAECRANHITHLIHGDLLTDHKLTFAAIGAPSSTPAAAIAPKPADLPPVQGPEVCPRECSQCPDNAGEPGVHHWLIESFDEASDDHPGIPLNTPVMVCKHCPAWRLVGEDEVIDQ